MKRLGRWLLVLVALGAVTVLVAGWLGYRAMQQPHTLPGRVLVDIPRGTSSSGIAATLEKEGVVANKWLFLATRWLKPGSKLQAGEYLFDQPLSAIAVYEKIARGDVHKYELRVPEGSNIFDIAEAAAKTGLTTEAAFLEAAKKPEMIRDLAPEAPTLEGFLFPDTYSFTRKATAEDICREMTKRFRDVWRELAVQDPKLDIEQLVTLASIIEKESAVKSERPLISGVFHNRLEKKMVLATDPTVIYAALIEGRWRGTIYRSDLQSKNPYNTYVHKGLPPGPIANPGREALRAAAHPAATKYLYFVAKPDGSGQHNFSATEAEHRKAVALYRSGR